MKPPWRPGTRANVRRLLALVALCGLLPTIAWWSVRLGATTVSTSDVLNAVFAFDGSREHLVIATIRLPRVLAGLLVGSGLAISGAIMQAMTNNPLASPSLMGINAGAAFAVVLTMSILGASADETYIWSAFAGAMSAAAIVYLFGTVGAARSSSIRLILGGAVLTAFLMSLTTAMLIFDQTALDNVRLWTAGSLTGRSLPQIRVVLPYMLIGFLAAALFSRHLSALSLGSDVARTLGQHPVIWRGLAASTVVLLAGGSVALAGPVGFVGLIVPHIVKLTVGFDYRWTIPFSALGGALLVVLADTVGRVIFSSQNFPVGVTMALIGAPFFIWLARIRVGGAR